MRLLRLAVVLGLTGGLATLGACGSTSDGQGPSHDGGAGSDDGTVGFGGDDGAGGFVGPDGGVIPPTGTLVLSPQNQTIDVAYGQAMPTVQYTATVQGQAVGASFAIDRGEIGNLGPATGLMTPSGTVAGTATVSATFGSQRVTTMVTVRVHYVQNGVPVTDAGVPDAGGGAGGNGGVGGEGPGAPVDTTTQMLLQATGDAGAGDAGGGAAWLYPYNQTVWPRGVLAPLLQWTTPKNYDAVFIHVSEASVDYQGFFAATATPFAHHPIPQSVWDLICNSNQGEKVEVSLVFSSGGVAYGPITETWTIAQGRLTGTVYYNSYGTNLAHNHPENGVTFGAATLAIKHGATSPTLVAGNDSECRVCHSVAANGSRLVTQQDDNDSAHSSTYDLMNGYAETSMTPSDSRFAWAALYPDGTFLMTDGAPGKAQSSVFLQGTNFDQQAQLFSLPSGASLASRGIPAGLRAASPVFSPDGKHVAFSFYGGSVPAGGDAGVITADKKTLAAMDFDLATHTFSNFRVIFTPQSGTSVWPSFLPTNDALVVEVETQNNGRDWGGTRSACDSTTCLNAATGAQGELWWVSLTDTAHPVRLDGLNGHGYLPQLAATNHVNDAVLNYEPTASPVPSGGYAWVVFTSRRLYGNIATLKPYWSDPRYVDLSTQPTTKKLWVAAVDLQGTPGVDRSHPAFYLPAQEILAGNSRGFWVVDPCQGNGSTCATGDECCGGYCENNTCSAQPPACSSMNDKCASDFDCCGVTDGTQCLSARCAVVAPPPAIGPK